MLLETIYGLPGLVCFLVDAPLQRVYSVPESVHTLIAGLTLLGNLLVNATHVS